MRSYQPVCKEIKNVPPSPPSLLPSSSHCSPESSKLFMTILVNLVHFNAVFIDDQCILELVQ